MSNNRNTFQQLRGMFQGTDQFMQSGHQIINSDRANAGPKRKNACWAKSDKEVRELLLSVFPKLDSNERQRMRAGKWARVIQLYFRSGLSYGDTAAEMQENKVFVHNVINRINAALVGFPCRGKKKPRKQSRTSLGAL